MEVTKVEIKKQLHTSKTRKHPQKVPAQRVKKALKTGVRTTKGNIDRGRYRYVYTHMWINRHKGLDFPGD